MWISGNGFSVKDTAAGGDVAKAGVPFSEGR